MSDRPEIKRRAAALVFAGMALAGTLLAAFPALADHRSALAPAPFSWGEIDSGEAGGVHVEGVRLAEADCSAAAAEAAAQTGGQVLSVSSRNQGGQTVCVVTVLVPGEDGQRPRKRTITLPQ